MQQKTIRWNCERFHTAPECGRPRPLQRNTTRAGRSCRAFAVMRLLRPGRAHSGTGPAFRCARWVSAALIFLLALSVSVAGVLKIELPPETASFKPGPGAGLANGNCLTCHSVEYVAMQPPLTPAAWTAEVKKMRDKYGAQIPEDQIAPIVDYLTQAYGVVTNGHPTAMPTENLPSAANLGVVALATRYGCLSCHSVNAKIVGPAYKDVAAKYHNDPQAFEKIAAQIHNGGSGKWGSVLMPPFPMVNDADTKMLADWIMSQAK